MARTKHQIIQQMSEAGVVAVIRAKSKDQLFDITQALLDGGIPSIEVTMSTPKAIAGIEALADKFGDKAIVGVGTCIDPATARDAIAAGAQFVVSPVFDPEIVATTIRYGKISVPGAYTPTEILRAWSQRLPMSSKSSPQPRWAPDISKTSSPPCRNFASPRPAASIPKPRRNGSKPARSSSAQARRW